MLYKLSWCNVACLPPNSQLSLFRLLGNLLFLLKFLFIVYFWLHWVFVAVCWLSLVSTSGGYSLVAVHELITAVASLVAAPRL